MIEQAKIVTHLDDMRLLADIKIHPIVSPENWNVYSDLCDLIDVVKEDALALLKEQGPAIPTWEKGKAYCGKCGQRLTRKSDGIERRYCSFCGKPVKWK